MNPPDRLRDLIIRHEGLSLKPYKCPAGYLTIGYGRNLEGNGISMREAEILLNNDILAAKSAAALFPWFDNLSAARRDVVISMIFNMGLRTFKEFKRMLAALQDGNYTLAAREMLFSAWAKQVGHRATELADIMRSGNYPPTT